MDCIYIAPLSKALYNVCLSFTHSHTYTHTHTHTPTHTTHQRRLAAMQGTNQLVRSNWGFGFLLRDTSTRPWVGSNRQPSDCQTTALTSWAVPPPYSDRRSISRAYLEPQSLPFMVDRGLCPRSKCLTQNLRFNSCESIPMKRGPTSLPVERRHSPRLGLRWRSVGGTGGWMWNDTPVLYFPVCMLIIRYVPAKSHG